MQLTLSQRKEIIEALGTLKPLKSEKPIEAEETQLIAKELTFQECKTYIEQLPKVDWLIVYDAISEAQDNTRKKLKIYLLEKLYFDPNGDFYIAYHCDGNKLKAFVYYRVFEELNKQYAKKIHSIWIGFRDVMHRLFVFLFSLFIGGVLIASALSVVGCFIACLWAMCGISAVSPFVVPFLLGGIPALFAAAVFVLSMIGFAFFYYCRSACSLLRCEAFFERLFAPIRDARIDLICGLSEGIFDRIGAKIEAMMPVVCCILFSIILFPISIPYAFFCLVKSLFIYSKMTNNTSSESKIIRRDRNEREMILCQMLGEIYENYKKDVESERKLYVHEAVRILNYLHYRKVMKDDDIAKNIKKYLFSDAVVMQTLCDLMKKNDLWKDKGSGVQGKDVWKSTFSIKWHIIQALFKYGKDCNDPEKQRIIRDFKKKLRDQLADYFHVFGEGYLNEDILSVVRAYLIGPEPASGQKESQQNVEIRESMNFLCKSGGYHPMFFLGQGAQEWLKEATKPEKGMVLQQ